MPSLRDLRRRIKGVQNMRKITKAMELVAAAAHASCAGTRACGAPVQRRDRQAS